MYIGFDWFSKQENIGFQSFQIGFQSKKVVRKDWFDGSPMAQALARWRGDVIIPLTVPNPRLHEPRSKPYLFNVSNQFSFKLILINSKRKNKINKF